MKKIGFIDYYLDEYHANHYPEMIKELSGGKLEVSYAFALKDSPNGMTTAEWCLRNGVENIADIKTLTEKSDCIVVLSPDNPETHPQLCEIPLSSGKPVYVDKTFAKTRREAVGMFEIANRHGTPCFSASALRFAPEFLEIDKNRIENISSWGPGEVENYSIHQIEPLIMLMGNEAKRVVSTGTGKHPSFTIEFADGRRAYFSHHGYECPFAMVADYREGNSKFISVSSDYFGFFVKEMVDFFLSGKAKVCHEQTICIISVIEAVKNALEHPEAWARIGD